METEMVKQKFQKCSPTSGCAYGLGFVGGAVYFISNATGFWLGALGFLKAIVWPAFMVYEVFMYLGA